MDCQREILMEVLGLACVRQPMWKSGTLVTRRLFGSLLWLLKRVLRAWTNSAPETLYPPKLHILNKVKVKLWFNVSDSYNCLR